MNRLDQNRSIVTLAMIMAASLVGLITGYTVPLISLNLAQHQVGTLYVGLLAALPPVGMMLSSFLSPVLCRHFEVRSLIAASLVLLALATVASCMTDSPLLLILPRLFTGLSSGVIVVLGESWITGSASNRHSAMLTGIYTSAFTGCQLTGPLILSAGDEYQPWALLGIIGISFACLFMLRGLPPNSRNSLAERESWKSLIPFLPVLSSGVFCFAFFDASVLALFPLYGIDKGLSESLAVLLITIILAGDALLQAPLGWLADRRGIRLVHIGCATIFCFMLLLLPFFIDSHFLLVANCFVLGASAGGMYTLSLVRAGKIFAGQKLIMINAFLGFFWSAGSVVGPVINGFIISMTNYDSLIVSLLVTGIFFLVIQFISNDKSVVENILINNENLSQKIFNDKEI